MLSSFIFSNYPGYPGNFLYFYENSYVPLLTIDSQ
jgi:hypothetical protein